MSTFESNSCQHFKRSSQISLRSLPANIAENAFLPRGLELMLTSEVEDSENSMTKQM